MTSFNYYEYRAALRNAWGLGQRERLLKAAEEDPNIGPHQLKQLRKYADRLAGKK